MFCFLTLQIKILFCKMLATCLCMKPPSTPSVEPRLPHTTNWGDATGDHRSNHSLNEIHSLPSSDCIPGTDSESVKKLLEEIRDLLKAQIHNEEEYSYENEKEEELKHDWMLAAAVIDRICAIGFTLVFIGGSLYFFILFVIHP